MRFGRQKRNAVVHRPGEGVKPSLGLTNRTQGNSSRHKKKGDPKEAQGYWEETHAKSSVLHARTNYNAQTTTSADTTHLSRKKLVRLRTHIYSNLD